MVLKPVCRPLKAKTGLKAKSGRERNLPLLSLKHTILTYNISVSLIWTIG
jgi:hypothetical protein